MRRRKLIAPIMTTVVMLGVLAAQLFACIHIPMWPLRIAIGLITLVLMGISIYVLYERIQEIRSGQEDDLSQY